jgi:segregation and condensation protein B
MVGSATRRIEAALFASARPVPRQALARAVGEGASVELLVADLPESPCDVVVVAEGFLLRTRPAYAPPLKKRETIGSI